MAVTWLGNSGETRLYFDGHEQTPFWRSAAGRIEEAYASSGGVDRHIASGTIRRPSGECLLLHSWST